MDKSKYMAIKHNRKISATKPRDGAAIAIKRNINHRIINNLSNNTVACKIQTGIGPLLIATMYIPPKRPIISRADFDILKTHNCPIYVLGDFYGNHRQLGNRKTNDLGEKLAELMEMDGITWAQILKHSIITKEVELLIKSWAINQTYSIGGYKEDLR